MRKRLSRLDLLAGQIEALQKLVTSKDDVIRGIANDLKSERTNRDAAEKQLSDSRQHFSDLKAKLYDAEIVTARLTGIIERVREVDTIMHPTVSETITREGPRDHIRNQGGGYGYSNEPRKPHWTSL